MKTAAMLAIPHQINQAEPPTLTAVDAHSFLTPFANQRGGSPSPVVVHSKKFLNAKAQTAVSGKLVPNSTLIKPLRFTKGSETPGNVSDTSTYLIVPSARNLIEERKKHAVYRNRIFRDIFDGHKDDSVKEKVWSIVRRLVEDWAALPADWDDDGAAPIDAAMLESVRNFVKECEIYNVGEPRPYVTSDGEVGFHWDGERRGAVSFLPEGRFLAYVDRSAGPAIRMAGPLDIATASVAMFEALRAFS